MVVALFSVNWSITCLAQQVAGDVAGAQVLTRGPVHEAFAGIVTFNPVPGVVVQKAPPEDIEEIPPGERPEGNNISWIPGYWAWDDERSDYLWVSGTWRALPPGRQWMAGYWGGTTQGYQWTSGYWADAAVQETTYLPAPPPTVEEGPSTKAPSSDYGWTPGNWMWNQERYAWSPGYWAQGRSDWDWMPAHYVWTPRGYIYVDGYWDYSVRRRGTLFAPVQFDSDVYSRHGYNYSPLIALDLAMFAEHLFVRPKYNHYYFGDYYAPRYNQDGYYAAYAYQSNRRGYDPIYSHQRWEHRDDKGWDQLKQANFRYRSDHENARPPRTWNEMRKIDASTAESKKNGMMVAAPIDQMAKRKDGPLRFRPVAKEDRDMIVQRGKDMRKSNSERRTLEAKGDGPPTIQKPGEAAVITKVKLPKSPIVAKSVSQFDKGHAPPAAQRSPRTKEPVDPKSETGGRTPNGDRPEPGKDNKRNTQPDRPTKGEEGAPQPTPERGVKKTPEKANEQLPPKQPKSPEPPKHVEKQVPPAPERRVKPVPDQEHKQPERRAPESASQREPRSNGKEKPPAKTEEVEQPGKKEHKKDS